MLALCLKPTCPRRLRRLGAPLGCRSKALGQGLLNAGIDQTKMIQSGDCEDPAHLMGGAADEESSAPALQPLVSEDDRRDPGGVDEVAPREADKNIDFVAYGGVESPSKLIGDG